MSYFLNDTTPELRRHWIKYAVRFLPKGKVTNYGVIANVVYGEHSKQLYGTNRWYYYTQPTAQAIRDLANQNSDKFPWWKVVDKNLRPPAHLLQEAQVKLKSEGTKLINGRVPREYYMCSTELMAMSEIKQIMREIETYIYRLPS